MDGLDRPDDTVEPIPPPPPLRAPPPTVRQTVRSALDALMASGADLRRLSIVAVAFGVLIVATPLAAAAAYGVVLPLSAAFGSSVDVLPLTLGLLALAASVAGMVGLFVLSIQVPLVIIAAVGGRLSGRPLDLRQCLRRARQTFWRAIAASLVVGVLTGIPALVMGGVLGQAFGPQTQLTLGLNLVASVAIASPWVYVFPGIVLGGVGVGESVRRSWGLARLRWRLALTIAVLAVVGQQIVIAAALSAVAIVVTVATVTPGTADVAAAVGAPALIGVAVLVAAVVLSSLLFATSAVQVAPETSGFFALTRYAEALDEARAEPAEPWLRPRPAILYGIGLLSALALATNLLAAWPIADRGPWQVVDVGGRAVEVPVGWVEAVREGRISGFVNEVGGAVTVAMGTEAEPAARLARRHLDTLVLTVDEVTEVASVEQVVEGITVCVTTFAGTFSGFAELPFEARFPVLVLSGPAGSVQLAVAVSYPEGAGPLGDLYAAEAQRFARHVWASVLGRT